MIVFLGPSQSHNLRRTERAKMTLSRAQYIVMPNNINFVLFHCKGTFWTRALSEKKAGDMSDTPNFRMCSQSHHRMNVDI